MQCLSEGNRHDIHNPPILLAGRSPEERPSHQVSQGNTAEHLHVTLLNNLGVPTEHFGDSNGELREISST
jgi:hypothetical protein